MQLLNNILVRDNNKKYMITLHKIWIICESLFVLALTWFIDILITAFAGLSIVNPMLKEILIDLKDVISIIVSISILILTIVRIKNEYKRPKNNEPK